MLLKAQQYYANTVQFVKKVIAAVVQFGKKVISLDQYLKFAVLAAILLIATLVLEVRGHGVIALLTVFIAGAAAGVAGFEYVLARVCVE